MKEGLKEALVSLVGRVKPTAIALAVLLGVLGVTAMVTGHEDVVTAIVIGLVAVIKELVND